MERFQVGLPNAAGATLPNAAISITSVSTNRSPRGDVIGAGTRGRQLGQNVSRACATPRYRLPLRLQPLRLAALPVGEQAHLAATPGVTGFNNQLIGINIAGFAPVGAPPYPPNTPWTAR